MPIRIALIKANQQLVVLAGSFTDFLQSLHQEKEAVYRLQPGTIQMSIVSQVS